MFLVTAEDAVLGEDAIQEDDVLPTAEDAVLWEDALQEDDDGNMVYYRRTYFYFEVLTVCI